MGRYFYRLEKKKSSGPAKEGRKGKEEAGGRFLRVRREKAAAVSPSTKKRKKRTAGRRPCADEGALEGRTREGD